MKLSSLKVLELNEKYKLIENLSKMQLENPEGVELELRVGRVEKIIGPSFLGVDREDELGKRFSPLTELIADITVDGNKKITMESDDYFLVRTIETINCPSDKIKYDVNSPPGYIIPGIKPRVSLQLGGVSLLCSTTNPGYSGPLTFGLKNNSKEKFDFELGARMFKIYWEPVIGEIKRTYEGQHQGERMTSQGEVEEQN